MKLFVPAGKQGPPRFSRPPVLNAYTCSSSATSSSYVLCGSRILAVPGDVVRCPVCLLTCVRQKCVCVLSKNLRLRCEEMNSCAQMLQMEIFTLLVIFCYFFFTRGQT